MTNQQETVRDEFDYWRSNPALRATICILMREWGSLNPAHAESDDEAIEAYRQDEDGRGELEGFETIATEIVEAATASAEARYLPVIEKLSSSLSYVMGKVITLYSMQITFRQAYELHKIKLECAQALALAAPLLGRE